MKKIISIIKKARISKDFDAILLYSDRRFYGDLTKQEKGLMDEIAGLLGDYSQYLRERATIHFEE